MRRALMTVTTLAFALAVLASPAQAQPGFTSGTQKYREKNPAGAKGRSGGATLDARMLVGKDGITRLEVTTGDFEDLAPPTGEFNRIKVAAIDANGAEMYSYQYRPAGGSYFSQTYPGLFAGQAFTVHSHVETPTKKNANVILTTTVQKRADILAERIVMPSRVPANVPVQIVGVLTELNGQIGARTNCVLYADDVEVDRSAAVWVDSGDSVSCAFSPTFPVLGAVRLRLAAEAVSPGDWDPANNALERLIEVSDLTPLFDAAAIEAVVLDTNKTGFREYGRYANTTLTAGYDWFYEQTVDRQSDAFVYAAAALGITHVPHALQISATDGLVSWTLQRAVPGCFDYAVGQVNGRSFYTYVTGCGHLYVEAGSFAGTVTYASRRLIQTFTVVGGTVVHDGPAQYIFNDVRTAVEDGANFLSGDTWTVDVAVAAGPFIFNAPISVQLTQPFDTGAIEPAVCQTTLTSWACSDSGWRIAGRSGEARFERTIPD